MSDKMADVEASGTHIIVTLVADDGDMLRHDFTIPSQEPIYLHEAMDEMRQIVEEVRAAKKHMDWFESRFGGRLGQWYFWANLVFNVMATAIGINIAVRLWLYW